MTNAEKIALCVVAASRLNQGKKSEYEAIKDAAFLAGFTWREILFSSPAIGEHAVIGIFFETKTEIHYFSACESCKDESVNTRDHEWRQYFKAENAKRSAKTA